eukprot:CAMPEP_0197039030 /NCGR_PEP_ID=MMETSP1384-20130603/15897_1 /TAXON_ID=29189 /ORGANISM="Ammonia sp." /LENGTH=272 /DNA_ID=CAMNT_0042469567 /DNA_START=23 /DNA_END=838 /DNA_ORIENTATION=-
MASSTGIPTMIDTPSEFQMVLDPGIRAFVLIPIFLVVFLRSLLSQSISLLVKAKPELKQRDRIEHAQAVRRSKRIRGNCNWIPPPAFAQRKKYIVNHSLAPIQVEKKEAGEQSIDDMNNMMSMMKGNTASYISNIGFMMWVNSFFAGFLLVRLPFSVSETFRPLVQRDVQLQPFDCSYVSSLSWYFISFFGLSGLNKLVLSKASQQNSDDPDMKAMKDMSAGMGMPMQQPQMNPMGGGYNPNDMFKKERNELKIVRHDWMVRDAEKKLLKKW